MDDSTQHLEAENGNDGSIVPGTPSFQTELEMVNAAVVDLLSQSKADISSTVLEKIELSPSLSLSKVQDFFYNGLGNYRTTDVLLTLSV